MDKSPPTTLDQTSSQALRDRHLQVRETITKLCETKSRPLPRLLAVSKGHGAEAIRIVYATGQREFGENYAQEVASKRASLQDLSDLRLVFIGRLQSNKIKTIVRDCDEIQSLANERHAALIAAQAKALGKTPYPVYYLVNAGGEASKDGMDLAQVPPFHQTITSQFPELAPQGLMAIPPPLLEDKPEHLEVLYKQLRNLASQIGAGLLSLGMSDDLEEALAAGSDCVRIGTAIFGPRPQKDSSQEGASKV